MCTGDCWRKLWEDHLDIIKRDHETQQRIQAWKKAVDTMQWAKPKQSETDKKIRLAELELQIAQAQLELARIQLANQNGA